MENLTHIILPFLLQVSGVLHNTGQSLVFRVDKDTKQHVNISGGPLAYRYQFEEIYIHYGTENSQGSEHHIHGYSFPGEVRIPVLGFSHIFPFKGDGRDALTFGAMTEGYYIFISCRRHFIVF